MGGSAKEKSNLIIWSYENKMLSLHVKPTLHSKFYLQEHTYLYYIKKKEWSIGDLSY